MTFPLGHNAVSYKWDPVHMSSGVEEIDQQHRELLRWLENLMQVIRAGQGLYVLETALDYLSAYADLHFACEEKCMDFYACPAAAVNRAGHARFRANLAGLRERIYQAGNPAELLTHIERDLIQWLKRHIQVVDSRLQASVKAAPHVPPPAC